MGIQTNISLRRRIITWSVIGYAISVLVVAPYLSLDTTKEKNSAGGISFGQLLPTTKAMVWPTYMWQRLTSPPFPDPLNAKAVTELKKFNLIWFYLAQVNRSLYEHQSRYSNPYSFLAACKGFDDYIAALHQMIYVSRGVDIHVLNGIYPELGTRFQDSWRKGASLMLNACIDGSPDKYTRSKQASDDWFGWYETNSVSIEAALKAVSH